MQSGMADTVKGSTLRKIGESLARFADVRETAKEPQDRIIVQANGMEIKFIAASTWGTLVATAHVTDQEFRAIIPARPFLQALKSTNAKQEYRIRDLNRGFEVGCTLVGDKQTDFLRLSKSLPRIMLPPDPQTAWSQGTIPIMAADLEELGRITEAVCDNVHDTVTVAGSIYTGDDSVAFAATDNHRFARRDIPAASFDLFGKISAKFLGATRAIGDATMEFWTDGKVTLTSSVYRAIGPYDMLVSGPLSFRDGAIEPIEHKAIVDRTKFVKSVREYAKLDKYGRIGVQLHNDAVEVLPFDKAKHGWFATSEHLLAPLTAISSKQVGIGLRTGRKQPINVRIPNWTIEIAPVELVPER